MKGEEGAEEQEELEQLQWRVAELKRAEIERRQAEGRLEHLNRVLRAIRSVNQLITRERNRERLLQGVCERLIETRGYYNAWIALLDEAGRLTAYAEAGLDKDFLPLLERLKRGELTGCARKALQRSGVVVIENPFSTCSDCPLAGQYAGRGAMTVRLEHEGKIYGFISLSIPRNLLGDEEEQSLLKEVAGDLAFALHDIELEEKHRRAEEVLRQSEENYRDLFENARDVIITFDLRGNITAVNNAVTEYGFRKDDLVGKSMLKFVAKRHWPRLLKELARVTRGKPFEGEIEVATPKGEKSAEYRSNPIRRGGKVVGFQTILRDITERKWLEGKLAVIRTLERRLVLSRDEAKIAQAMVEAVREVLGIEDCGLFLVDEEGQRLILAAHSLGCPPGPEKFPLDSERGIVPAVARLGETIYYVPDTSQESRFWPGTRPNRSELCVPLKVKGRVLGVLNAESEELDAFSLEDRQLLEVLANASAVALENVRLFTALEQSNTRLQQLLQRMVDVLTATIETRDPYIVGHQRRVTELACEIARELGLPQGQIEGLRMAGLIHDIGKISVPSEILSKPGRLTDMEFEMIKRHPQVGYNILKEIEFPWPVADIILQHHERLDGSGYPQGLKGDEIILEARILAVADVVEAMSSHRPYRPAHKLDEALEEISKNRGILYDPQVVDACLRLFRERGFTFEQEGEGN